jgi:hypothetical protein
LTSFTVDLEHLVWRTRGQAWDYAFIRLPPEGGTGVSSERWFDLLSEAYPEISANAPDDLVAGRIDGDIAFASARVIDSQVCDSWHRPVRHYFAVAGVSPSAFEAIPERWGTQLLAELRALLDVSGCLSAHGPERLRHALADIIRTNRQITLTGEAMRPTRRDLGRSRSRIGAALLVGAAIVIIAGVAVVARSLH